jgi:CubicO group peptidase (beta-lactamase class C family)
MNRRSALRSLGGTFFYVVLLLASHHPSAAQEPFPGLEKYLSDAVTAWKLPALSIAIVRNDSVIYAKGFGTLAVGNNQPVNEQTLFEIGSNTKAFTATLIAMLVSDGKMSFDGRVTEYLPDFRLADPVANAQVTVRDLLTHRTGLGRGELVWLGSGASRAELLHRIRFLEPQSPFRSRYSYQNVMFLAAGEAAGKASGSSWDEQIAQRIFTPLRMTSSVTSAKRVSTRNVALPHGVIRDSAYAKPLWNADNIGPAGSILSSAQDMAQWLRFQLGDGVYEGKRLLKSEPFRETHTPQVLTGSGAGAPGDRTTLFSTYALGWQVQDYRGQVMWTHTGGTDGMSSVVGLLPDQKFGVVILTNVSSGSVHPLLMRWVFDRQLNAPLRDLAGEARTRVLAQRARADSIAAAQPTARKAAGQLPLPASAYAGVYVDSLYGEATVAVDGARITLKRGEWSGPLEYWNGTNFRWTVPTNPVGQPQYVKFDVGPNDRVTGLYFGESGDAPLLRRKAAPSPARGPGTRP